jgi:hypothetical protein
METLLASDSIRKRLEARRRLQEAKGNQTTGHEDQIGARREPAAGQAISECAKAIEGAIRSSIRESFSAWGSNLIPEIGARARETISSIDRKVPSPSTPPQVVPAKRSEEAREEVLRPHPVPPQEAPRSPKIERVARVVPAAPIARPEPAAPVTAASIAHVQVAQAPVAPMQTAIKAGASPPMPVKSAPIAPDRAPKFPVPGPPASSPPPPGGEGKGAGRPGGDSWNDLVEAVCELRRNWDRETFEKCFEGVGAAPVEAAAEQDRKEPASAGIPEPIPDAPAPPSGRTLRAAGTETALTEPAAMTASLTSPREAVPDPSSSLPEEGGQVSDKLDELIRLVKVSLEDRPSPGPARLPSEVTSQIAREVAGRLKDTLGNLKASPAPAEASREQKREPQSPPRIPIDDIAAMIDLLNGSKP